MVPIKQHVILITCFLHQFYGVYEFQCVRLLNAALVNCEVIHWFFSSQTYQRSVIGKSLPQKCQIIEFKTQPGAI